VILDLMEAKLSLEKTLAALGPLEMNIERRNRFRHCQVPILKQDD
jgi:hypothetical protein